MVSVSICPDYSNLLLLSVGMDMAHYTGTPNHYSTHYVIGQLLLPYRVSGGGGGLWDCGYYMRIFIKPELIEHMQ